MSEKMVVLGRIVQFSKPQSQKGRDKLSSLSQELERLMQESKRLHEEEGEVNSALLGQVREVYAEIADLR